MKVEVKDITPAVKTTYPCLKISDDTIVLFTSPKTGMCLQSKYNPVGDYDVCWAEGSFVPLQGTVTLSN